MCSLTHVLERLAGEFLVSFCTAGVSAFSEQAPPCGTLTAKDLALPRDTQAAASQDCPWRHSPCVGAPLAAQAPALLWRRFSERWASSKRCWEGQGRGSARLVKPHSPTRLPYVEAGVCVEEHARRPGRLGTHRRVDNIGPPSLALNEVMTYFACCLFFFFFLKKISSIYFQKGEGREKEREKNISVWLLLACPLLGTWPATQACALTGN